MIVFGLFFTATQSTNAAVSSWPYQGINIDPRTTTEFSSANFKQSVTNLSKTGANYVTLIIPYYQTDFKTTDIQAGYNTPTDESLIQGIQHVRSLGMQVMLKFHLESKAGGWRAGINPSDRASWFRNYGNMVEYYARIAKQYGVKSICLGAELIRMTVPSYNATNTSNWKALINRIRAVYPKESGTLTYSAQRTDSYNEVGLIQFWGDLDYIGISGYYPLSPSEAYPTVESLKNSWHKIQVENIKPLYDKFQKPIVFTEIGYRSVNGANNAPSYWSQTGTYNGQLQANLYEALFSYWNNYSYMQGVQLWEWQSNPNAGGIGSVSYTPQNKPAQAVMTKWFGGSTSATPTPSPTTNPTVAPTKSPTPSPSLTPTKTPTPLPTSTTYQVSIWWPTEGSTLSGTQPFKGVVSQLQLTQYKMFWQVNGGQLNLMYDSYTSAPHKEARVDVSNWTWRGRGPYTINFVAQDLNGKAIGNKSVNVYVSS